MVQSIRQQQDEAYEESLRADQEKERLKKIEQDKLIQEQQELEAQRLAREQLKEVGHTHCTPFPQSFRVYVDCLFRCRKLLGKKLNEY